MNRLPESIRRLTEGKPYRCDETGMSGSRILVFEDSVLKIGKYDDGETVRVMRWLEGKLPVPRVICYEQDGENKYLLMSRIPGKMSCDT